MSSLRHNRESTEQHQSRWSSSWEFRQNTPEWRKNESKQRWKTNEKRFCPSSSKWSSENSQSTKKRRQQETEQQPNKKKREKGKFGAIFHVSHFTLVRECCRTAEPHARAHMCRRLTYNSLHSPPPSLSKVSDCHTRMTEIRHDNGSPTYDIKMSYRK